MTLCRRVLAILVTVGLLIPLLVRPTASGEGYMDRILLFGGSDVDSTEQASPWFLIYGARRVVLRTWSTHVAFDAATDADSTFADSIAGFRVLVSDSVSHRATGPDGRSYPVCADSFVIGGALLDTTSVQISVHAPPVNKTLRAPANGSGLISFVMGVPVSIGAGIANNHLFGKTYMRIRVTPLRRNTVTGGNSTQGKRVNGLKGLKMWAYVFYDNR